jgi:hypothetical protein
MSEQKIDFAYVFAGEDPNNFYKELTDFKKGKVIKECHISVSQVMIGVIGDGRGGQIAQMKAVPCAFIVWETTQKEVDSFLFNLQMLGKQ